MKTFDGVNIIKNVFTDNWKTGINFVSWPSDGIWDHRRDAYLYSKNVLITDNIFYNPSSYRIRDEASPGIVLNRVDTAHVHRNVFVRLAGSGFWCTQTYGVVFSHNIVAEGVRVTDTTTNHIDIQVDGAVFEYNIGYKNEGGFFESMGLSDNNVARYCISVDEGMADDPADGDRAHQANSIFFTGYTAEDDRVGPTNVTLHNNMIVSTGSVGATQYMSVIDYPTGIYLADNEIIVGNGHWDTLKTYYDVATFTSASNLIGGPQAALDSFNAAFTSSGNALMAEADSVSYADLVGNVVKTYMEKHPLTMSYAELHTALCELSEPAAVTAAKAGMPFADPITSWGPTIAPADGDFCGRPIPAGGFIGAMTPYDASAPTRTPTASPTVTPLFTDPPTTAAPTMRCDGWCHNPSNANCDRSYAACVGCEPCSDSALNSDTDIQEAYDAPPGAEFVSPPPGVASSTIDGDSGACRSSLSLMAVMCVLTVAALA
jgi:hypothetical protein